MVILVVHHFVKDFDAWKPVFDEHETVRRGHGALEHRVYRDPGNGNRVVVHVDFPTIDAARAFAADPSLPEAMARGGVEGEPTPGFAELTERKRYADGAAGVTLVVHHRVRDFATWRPVFDEHETVRRQHGEVEHRLFQSYGDPNGVIIHNDFPAEADARAFMEDPSLPEAMERAGVEGKPGLGFLALSERVVYEPAPVG